MNRPQGTGKYEQLLVRCRSLNPIATAVAHPCESSVLVAVLEAAAKGLIAPILVGPAAKIEEVAKKSGLTLGQTRIVDAAHSHDAAKKAVELIRQGEAEILMKGSLHTDELLSAVASHGCATAVVIGSRLRQRLRSCSYLPVPVCAVVMA